MHRFLVIPLDDAEFPSCQPQVRRACERLRVMRPGIVHQVKDGAYHLAVLLGRAGAGSAAASGVASTAIYVGKLLHVLEPGDVFC